MCYIKKLYKDYMRDFNQSIYAGERALMASTGKVFVPPACSKRGAACNVHMFFHGCDVTDTFDVFSEYGGFNEWAINNRFVIVYPKMGTNDRSNKQMHSGCWDGYGDTGPDYDLRSGPQMRAVEAMIRGMRGF